VLKLPKNQFRQWNACVAKITAETDPDNILGLLADGCRVLLPADAIFAAIYGKSMKPIPVFDDVPDKNRSKVIDMYIDGAYLLDPFYRAGIDGIKEGLYHLTEVGPPGFEKSEFYKRYFHQCGIGDEIGFLTYLSDGCFANFSLVRMEGSEDFDKKGVQRLRLAQDVVHKSLVRYWTARAAERSRSSSELHSQLEVALSHFGNSVLTDREAEVIRLYLKGHSTASITDRLGISYHTVSTHRKSAYQKLDINSQGELFHMFIDSLSCFDPVAQRDPLRGYLSVAK